MIGRRRRRDSAGRLVVIMVVLLLCIWLLYRLFIGIPPAPAPEVKQAGMTLLTASVGCAWGSCLTHTTEACSLSALAPVLRSHTRC